MQTTAGLLRHLAYCVAVALAGVMARPDMAHAQRARSPLVSIVLPASVNEVLPIVAEGGPRIVTENILASGDLRELIRSGFPAQLHYRLELWRTGGWFDDLEALMEWDVVIAYDPARQLYRVRRFSGAHNEDLGAFATLTSVETVLERPLRAPLIPSRMGRRYYYNLVLDVEALSVSDLDQLERWLRGELGPAVSGRNNPVSAMSSGVRTLVTRVLGGERIQYRKRSGGFRAG